MINKYLLVTLDQTYARSLNNEQFDSRVEELTSAFKSFGRLHHVDINYGKWLIELAHEELPRMDEFAVTVKEFTDDGKMWWVIPDAGSCAWRYDAEPTEWRLVDILKFVLEWEEEGKFNGQTCYIDSLAWFTSPDDRRKAVVEADTVRQSFCDALDILRENGVTSGTVIDTLFASYKNELMDIARKAHVEMMMNSDDEEMFAMHLAVREQANWELKCNGDREWMEEQRFEAMTLGEWDYDTSTPNW